MTSQETPETIVVDWNAMTVRSEQRIRSPKDLTTHSESQLSLIMKNHYWGDAKTVEDCSKERFVDDGIIMYKELEGSNDSDESRRFYYWQAYFGGNPTGYLLTDKIVADGEEDNNSTNWTLLVENCDGEFIWRGPGKRPLRFLNQIKKAAMGRYYDEEVDLIADDNDDDNNNNGQQVCVCLCV
jgi:hypothetical protein